MGPHNPASAEHKEIFKDVGLVLTKIDDDWDIFFEYCKEISARDDRHAHFWRRNAFRIAFADIEARVYQLRRICLAVYKAGFRGFESYEIGLLEDKYYRLKNGKVQPMDAKTSLTDGILFTAEMFAKIYGTVSPIDTGGEPEWALLKACVTVRARLMHPKTVSDLEVSLDEVNCLNRVEKWIKSKLSQLAAEAQDFLAKPDNLGPNDPTKTVNPIDTP
jgi:hypothetical protein